MNHLKNAARNLCSYNGSTGSLHGFGGSSILSQRTNKTYEINYISRYALIRWNRDALISFISLYANRVRGCKIARRTDEGKTVKPVG